MCLSNPAVAGQVPSNEDGYGSPSRGYGCGPIPFCCTLLFVCFKKCPKPVFLFVLEDVDFLLVFFELENIERMFGKFPVISIVES